MDKVKDTIANIVIVLTMIFKLFILGAVLIVFSNLEWNTIIYIAIIICGAIWTLGMQNINMIYYMLKKK